MKFQKLLTILTILLLGGSGLMAYPWPELTCATDTCYDARYVEDAPDEIIPDLGYEVKEAFLMRSPFNRKEKLFIFVFSAGSGVEDDDPYYSSCFHEYDTIEAEVGDKIGCIELGQNATLYLRGGKSIYSRVYNNGHYSKHKYTLDPYRGIKEVEQPFLYIGEAAIVEVPDDKECGGYDGPKVLTLYQDQSEDQAVAVLPDGYDIEVVLRDGDWYLIKSSFGLVGWAQNPTPFHSFFDMGTYSCAG